MLARENMMRAERQAAEMAAQQAAYAPQHQMPQPLSHPAWQPGAPSYDVSPASHPPVAPAYVPPPTYAPAAPAYSTQPAPPPAPAPTTSYFAQQTTAPANYSIHG